MGEYIYTPYVWKTVLMFAKLKKKFAGIHGMLPVYLKFCNFIMCNVIYLKKLLILPILFTNLGCFCRILETSC